MSLEPIDWTAPEPARPVALSRPTTAAQALAEYRRLAPDAAFLAGGTALSLAWGVAEEERPGVGTLIDLLGGAVATGIEPASLPDGRPALRVGAGTTLEAMRRDASVWMRARRLAEAIDAIGAPGVRHLATLGGNIGWRWGDTLPALLAADAWVSLAEGGARPLATVLELARGEQAPLPLLDAVFWPQRPAPVTGWSVCEKLGARAAFSPSRLTLAIEARCEGGVIAQPCVAATAAGWPARRLPAAEAWLAGRSPAELAGAVSALQSACLADTEDPARARLVARLLAGHLSREAALHG